MLRRGRGRPPHPDILTPAEWRVLREIRTGASNAEIAVRLGLGNATVKFHIRNIRNKLELTDRADLVAWRGEPQADAQPASRRWMLAPIGLLVGYWKTVVAGAAITVVGGGAIAAGVLAYTIVNEEEPAASPRDEPASAATASPTPAPGEATSPPATAAPSATDTPVATPEPTVEPTPPPVATETPGETPTRQAGEEGEPSVTFWGDVPEAEQATVRTRVADVVQFFDERFGVRVPNLEVHVGADSAALEAATQDALGEAAFVGSAQYREGVVFVDIAEAHRAIERLYFHAIQVQLTGSSSWGPWWLGEGAAMYAARLFREWRGETTLGAALATDQWAASYQETPLQELEAGSPTEPESFDSATLSLATLAVDWLVGQAGEGSLVAYYRTLPGSGGWRSAFESTFGIPFEGVYAEFAAHRADVVQKRWALRGLVLGPGDELLGDWPLHIEAHLDGTQHSESAPVDDSGSFTVRPPDGTYRVAVVCLPSWGTLGWYGGESGFTTQEGEAVPVVVDGEDVGGIVIRLPAAPDELLPACEEGGWP